MAHRGRTATRVPAFVAIVTVLVAWTQLCAAQTTTGCTKYTLPAGWEFKQGVDSSGYDVVYSGITSGDWPTLVAACDGTPGCKALNTHGWFKYQLASSFYSFTTDPCKGLLVRLGDPPIPLRCVKFSLPPSGWEFKQGMDINGNDVTNVPNTGGDWAKLIAGCDATPGCRYINTGGWAKYAATSWRGPTTTDPCSGMLVRLGEPPIPLRCVKFTLPATGWAFKQGVDAYGNDLTNVGANGGDWAKLITACDATPGCRYINTGGWAKYKIVSYQNTSTIDPCVGMLVRQGDPPIPIRCVKYSLPAIGGWAFKQSMDATGTDAGTTTSSGDWTRAITACDAKPGCIAISVTGSSSTSVMKSTISGYRNTSTDDPCAGLLERSNSTTPQPALLATPSPAPSPSPSPSPAPPSPSPSPVPAAELPMASSPDPPLEPVTYVAKVPVGINLPRLDQATPHYGGAWAAAGTTIFTDIFKHATPFACEQRPAGGGAWGWGDGKCPLRPEDGYPSAILQPESWRQYGAASKVGSPGAAYYAAGKYVLLYDGQGKILVDGDATMTWQQPGRIGLTLTPASGFAVRIVETNTSNPVRNISIVPAAKETTYGSDVYQPGFLKLVNGLKVLRFSAWQRVWGRAEGLEMAPRNWGQRSTPSTHSYLRKDGVSVEHMVALANKINAAPFFSLPLANGTSDAYIAGLATVVAKQLAEGLEVYIEVGRGGPGWMTTDLAKRLLPIARIWRQAFTDAGADPRRIVVVATYESHTWIPYFWDTFTPSEQAEVNAIGVVGVYGSRSWNGGKLPCYFDFASLSWLRANPNITYETAVSLARRSVLHADIAHNRWASRLKASGKRLLGLQGGPDSSNSMQAPYYAMRMNYQAIASCSSYPCTKSPLYGLDSGSMTFDSEAARNTTLDSLLPLAAAEYNLEEQLMQIKLREPNTTDHMLDFLHRWQMAGGAAMFVQLPEPACCTCGPGTPVLIPKECQANSSITNQATPESSPIFKAVRAFIRGSNGSLPLTADWSIKPTPCEPACSKGTCVKGKCVCYAGWSGEACDTPTSRPNECNSLVGTNLEGIADWSHSWTFVDVMKSGRAWISQYHDNTGGWGNTTGVARMAGDWPASLEVNQKAGSILIRDLQGHVPAGTYTLQWEGDGIVDIGSFDVQQTRHIAAGLAEVDVKPSTEFNNGLFVTVERTNPANPVRNIRVLMPGFDAAAADALPFHPRFLATLKPYGVLRFMEFMRANMQGPATWEERSKPTDRSFAGHNTAGVPLEWMVQLANHVGAAPWFTLNHMSDDEFHARFAQQVKDTLRPDLSVKIEWSNEAWHTGFEGGKYAQAEGLRLNMVEEGAKWYGGATNEARLCYIAERTKRMAQIWKQVFSDDPSRVVVVIAGQASWPVASEKVFTCRNVTSSVDAFAIGPYFGDWKSTDTDLNTFVTTKLPAQIDDGLKNWVAPHAAIAKKYNKPLIAYEAGQSLTGDSPVPMEANRHPGMKAAYSKYMEGLLSAGLSHINHYVAISAYSKYGSWGLQEWQDQDPATAPKLQAVQEFIDAHAQCDANSTDGSNNTLASNPGGSCEQGCDHGTCIDGLCGCFTGFSGPTCNITSYTDKFDCGYKCTFDQGACAVTSVQGSIKNWGCTCEEGFFGVTCSLFKCPNDCSYSGTCLDKGVCACYPGHSGPACEIDCGCNGHGMCSANNTCLCDAGYKLGANGCEPDCVCEDASVGCVAPGECGCKDCVNGACFNGRCECWAGYSGAGCTVLNASARANTGSPVGVEVSGPAYWSTQWTWINAMAQSSPGWWTQRAADRGDLTNISPLFDAGVTLELRPDGYPRSLPEGVIAHKLVLRNVQTRAMPGRYVALWDGDGVVDVAFDAKVASVGKRRLEFDYNPTADQACWERGEAYCGDNGIWVVLRATNPANPVHNIRIMPKALENVADRQPFHPWVLKDLERYSVLRFMSWLATNVDGAGSGAPTRVWGQRVLPDQESQTGSGGVAWEYIVGLCNQLGASPWINIHHLADDAYVEAVAQYLKEKLRPDVNVFVEHSNEVWNQMFPQGKYAREQGLALGLSDKADIAGYRYHAKRSGEIFDIFTRVFGAEARRARLKYIVSSWAFICNNGAGCGATAVNATLGYGDVAQKADALGLTAYFGCGLGANGAADALLSVDNMMAKCNSESELQQVRSTLMTLKGYAGSYGLPVATYEAGPSIVEASQISGSKGSQAAALKYIALQRDPRFEAVYAKYLQMFDEVALISEAFPLMQFASASYPSKYGSWGLLEYTGQDPSTAPKARALHAVLDAKQPVSSIRPGCFHPAMGAAGLADGQYSGVPAMLTPGKGATWVQGVEYNITFPALRSPTGSISVAIFKDTDCNTQQPLATVESLTVSAATRFETFATFRVPADLPVGSGYILRVQGTVNGAAATIYSEAFAVQQLRTAGGACNANLPYLPPAPRCSPELAWNVSAGPTGMCKFEANGCRTYRTASNWYSSGKPVTDCTAQFSPRPSRAALAAANALVGGDNC